MSHASNPDREYFKLSGHLGPIQASKDKPLELSIAPLTVFIGPQGTGKSLVSQLLYFFRDARYLISKYSKQAEPEASVRKVIEGIRTGEGSPRAFASFVTNKSVTLEYLPTQQTSAIQSSSTSNPWTVSLLNQSRRIYPTRDFRKSVQKWLASISEDPTKVPRQFPSTLFIPAERSFFSRLINSNPAALASNDLPISMLEFTSFLSQAGNTHESWQSPESAASDLLPVEFDEIRTLVSRELRGNAQFSRTGPYRYKWQWIPDEGSNAIEMEMASSGQMEAWPMVSITQAIFGWEAERRPLFIHIEEPETHLHPSAQVAIAKLLAYLCNKGFRLVITTHSLLVIYTLNNLLLASQTLPDEPLEGMPDLKQRLNPDLLEAYLFNDGTAVSIRDSETGELDESRLSQVLGNLEVEYNRIQAYEFFRK